MRGRRKLHLPQYYSTLNQINHKREHEHHHGYLIENVSTENKQADQINVRQYEEDDKE